MTAARVRYVPSERGPKFPVEGHGQLSALGIVGYDEHAYGEHGDLIGTLVVVGTLEVAGPVSLSSLRHALTAYLRDQRSDVTEAELRLSTLPEQDFDPHGEWGSEHASLFLHEGQLLIKVHEPFGSRASAAAVRTLLTPLLDRYAARLELIEPHAWMDRPFRIAIDWSLRGRTVLDAWKLGSEISTLLHAAEGGELTLASTLDLLRGRRWDVLRGQPESDWLDAKTEPYDTQRPNWKYELAKDVAAFANAPTGGLIVLGMTTKDRGDGEIITGVKEFRLGTLHRQTYRNHVTGFVYPRVVGFEVERIGGDKPGHGLAVLVVPPQSDSSKPFLVHGVIKKDGVLGAHVLIAVRQGDHTALLDPGAIHARLRLGEQAIAGDLRRADQREAPTGIEPV